MEVVERSGSTREQPKCKNTHQRIRALAARSSRLQCILDECNPPPNVLNQSGHVHSHEQVWFSISLRSWSFATQDFNCAGCPGHGVQRCWSWRLHGGGLRSHLTVHASTWGCAWRALLPQISLAWETRGGVLHWRFEGCESLTWSHLVRGTCCFNVHLGRMREVRERLRYAPWRRWRGV
jgi:hypothetical protein